MPSAGPKEKTMKMLIKSLIIQTLALLLSVAPVFAEERSRYQQPELDQMLAPIALYPDALLSQILMASTYPIEVVQAARWSAARPYLKGQEAVQAAENEDWDPSVKSLVAFPEILSMMNQKLDWTERLGDAFLAQQVQVMDTVQYLRRKAEAAGNLHSGEHLNVLRQNETIIIEQANPRIVYVPYYNPVVVYGSWWWPGYPPVYWAPWPGYYAGPAFVPGFYWGSGITISTGFFFGAFDWHHRHVRIVHVDYYRSHARVSRRATIVHDRPGAWRHDPGHRRGAPYRYAVQQQQSRNAAPVRNYTRGEIQQRSAVPAVREQDTRQSGSRRGTDATIQSGNTATTPVPRVERREAERTRPGSDRQGREFREPREWPGTRGNERSDTPAESGRNQSNRLAQPVPAPVAREAERARPEPDRRGREIREPRESRDAQRERPSVRGADRSASRSEPARSQALPAPVPAVRESRPAATQRPQSATQNAGQQGNRFRQEGREAGRRPAAAPSHPRVQTGGETRRGGGDAPRREFTPSARRPAPG
jgi:hypothetical protein